jgi:hypothetical protein
VRIVPYQFQMIHPEIVDVLHAGIQSQSGEGSRFSLQLNVQGIDVVSVHVSVSHDVHQITWSRVTKRDASLDE